MSQIIIALLSFLFAINSTFGINDVLIIQDSNTITDTRYDNLDGYIDIYYYFFDTPSSNGLAFQVLRNGNHIETHQMSAYSDIYKSTNQQQAPTSLLKGNLYRYRLEVNNFQHTDLWTIKIVNSSGTSISYVGTIGVYVSVVVDNYRGYYDGYEQGLTDGYDNGYDSGYSQGINDYQNRVEETENVIGRIWDIITSATNAVLNVFSFPILPGIPLYMLVAIPVILAVILFIIRGLAK